MEVKYYIDYSWTSIRVDAHDCIFPAVLSLIHKTGASQNAFILDAGCGSGALVALLYSKGFKNVYGFDASNSGIDLAKKEYKEISDRFFIHYAEDKNLPSYVPSTYDLIISTEVIEHLYNPELYLVNINSWLKDNGYLIITTPYHGYFKNLLIAILNKNDSHYNPLWVGGHIKFFSKKTLTILLEKTGFKLVSFQGCGRLPFLWKSMIVLAQKS